MSSKNLLLTLSLCLAPQTLLQGSALADLFTDHTATNRRGAPLYSLKAQQEIVNTKRPFAQFLKAAGGCGTVGYYIYALRGAKQGKTLKELFPRKHVMGISASIITFALGHTWSESLWDWEMQIYRKDQERKNQAERDKANAARAREHKLQHERDAAWEKERHEKQEAEMKAAIDANIQRDARLTEEERRRRAELEAADLEVARKMEADWLREDREEQERALVAQRQRRAEQEAAAAKAAAEAKAKADKEAAEPKDCLICAETKRTDAFPALSCTHAMCCLDCLKVVINTALDEAKLQDVCCQEPTCKKRLTAAEINRILTPDQRQKYAQLQVEENVRAQAGIAKCPKPGCKRRFQRTENPQVRVCDDAQCGTVCCAACAQPHPAEAKTCAEAAAIEAQAAAEIERKKTPEQREQDDATRKSIKQCPDCGIPIVKDNMCKWVKCDKCKYGFCFTCLKGPFYNHDDHECTDLY